MAISNDCFSHTDRNPFMTVCNMLQRQKLIFHNKHENNSLNKKQRTGKHNSTMFYILTANTQCNWKKAHQQNQQQLTILIDKFNFYQLTCVFHTNVIHVYTFPMILNINICYLPTVQFTLSICRCWWSSSGQIDQP